MAPAISGRTRSSSSCRSPAGTRESVYQSVRHRCRSAAVAQGPHRREGSDLYCSRRCEKTCSIPHRFTNTNALEVKKIEGQKGGVRAKGHVKNQQDPENENDRTTCSIAHRLIGRGGAELPSSGSPRKHVRFRILVMNVRCLPFSKRLLPSNRHWW